MSHLTSLDQEINSWYELQSEETLLDLQGRFDADTPRKAWKAFFNDCAFPAQQSSSDSLAAPADAGQGVCTRSKYVRRSVGLLPQHFSELSVIAADEGRSIESVMRSLIVLGLLSRRQGGRA